MPKLANLRKIYLAILIVSIVCLLTGCGINNGEDENSKKEKLDQEMSFLDSKIVDMMNRLNNISFSNYKVVSEDIKQEKTGSTSGNEKNTSSQSDTSPDSSSSSDQGSDSKSDSGQQSESSNKGDAPDNSKASENRQIFKMSQDVLLLNDDEQDEEIKWGEIRKDVENIYSIWPTISIDLANIGVNNQDITEFNKILDDIAIDVKDKQQSRSLTDLAKLYNMLPKYMNYYSDEELIKNIINIKSYVLNSYSLINDENWDEAKVKLMQADEIFSNVITNQNIYENRELNINRSYLLLNDLKQSIEKKDKQIFYVRYKNLLQELNIIG